MNLDPVRGRAQGVVLAAAALLAGACNDPEQNSDLRPSGPPEVLSVLVMNDPVAMLGEKATYCKPDDEKRPAQVGLPDFTISVVCDPDLAVAAEPVTDAYPDGWYVRIMFDELLDPNIEELTEILDENGAGTDTYTGSIANTQPVNLQCESIGGGFVDVPYDGYYSPAGNRESWPLGPSLVIKPNDPTVVATGKNCRVTLNDNVVDKNGEPVPADQRGPFAFRLATVQPIFSSPADGDEITPLAVYFDNVYVQFNTLIDAGSFCDGGVGMDECEFSFGTELDAGGLYAYSLDTGALADEFGFGPVDAAKENTPYTFSFLEGTTVRDRCGQEIAFGAPSAAAGTLIEFTTSAFEFDLTRPKNGDTFAAARRFSMQFTNVIDLASLEPTEYSISPAPELPVGTDPAGSSAFNDGDFLFNGFFAPDTQYTFTLNAGATVLDAHGAVSTQGAAPLVVEWTTQPITLSSVTPANDSTVVKATTASTTRITLSFNTAMDVATLTADDFTLTGPGGLPVPAVITVAPDDYGIPSCDADSVATSCTFRVTSAAALLPGDYTFTLKAGAMISDRMTTPHVFTQAADRVVNFTVEEAGPAEPPHVCL